MHYVLQLWTFDLSLSFNRNGLQSIVEILFYKHWLTCYSFHDYITKVPVKFNFEVKLSCYSMQGDSKHLLLAHLFDKPCFLGLLAVQVMITVIYMTRLLFSPYSII